MSDEDRMVLMCSSETMLHTDDSELVDGNCGHKVWVSQSGLRMRVDAPNVEFICMPCMDPKAFLEATIAQGGLRNPQGAKEELARELGADNPVVKLIQALSKDFDPKNPYA